MCPLDLLKSPCFHFLIMVSHSVIPQMVLFYVEVKSCYGYYITRLKVGVSTECIFTEAGFLIPGFIYAVLHDFSEGMCM